MPRALAFVVLATAAVLVTGCKSNNTNKILGKWKLVDSPGYNTPDGRAAIELGLFVVVDFQPDNKMVISVESDSSFVMTKLQQVAPGGKTSFNAKYSLGFGDSVSLSDIDKDAQKFIKPGRWEVTITGPRMSVRTADGVEKYERISAYAAPTDGR